MSGFTRAELEARGHPLWAEIDLDALRHNVRVLAARAGGAELMGVVKSYAYGHGNPECARAMLEAGATRLGVARVAEALHLRDRGVTAPIHVFTEPPPAAAPALVANDLVATVYTEGFALALSDAAVAAGTTVKTHLKVDTGMHRVGVPASHALDAIGSLARLEGLEIEGIWSHLAVADVPDHPYNRKQLDLFDEIVTAAERAGTRFSYKHIANSAAILSLPESHLDMVRAGVACYGLWPGPELAGAAELRPVMALRARINMVKTVPAGDRLSYGLTYEMPRTSQVVTVPAGYADGYGRLLSGKADVVIRGRRHRVSGTVCMDQFMVDVGDAPVEVGEVVTLLGRDGNEQVTAEELAHLMGTINYEVTARIPSRVVRLFSGKGAR